jgi:hypothetical protein
VLLAVLVTNDAGGAFSFFGHKGSGENCTVQ